MATFTRSLFQFFPMGLLLHGFVCADVITVGPSGDHATIGAAVAAADPEDMIDVVAGIFEESITLDKPLTIRGANGGISAGTVAGVRGAETIVRGGVRVLAAASGSVISGLRVEEGLEDGGFRIGVLIDAADVTLRDSVVTGAGVVPALIPGSHGVRITPNASGTRIVDSRITANAAGLLAIMTTGIEIRGSRIDAHAGDGVVFQDTTGAALNGNRIETHGGVGVRAIGTTSGVELRNNLLVGNGVAVANGAVAGIDATRNFWDSGQSPPVQDGANGYSGAVVFSPWFADAALQTLVEGVFSDLTVAEGETLTADVLVISDGVTLRIERGKAVVKRLDLDAGGTLEVIDGDLVLGVPSGGTHTIAGTFRIIHSLGSIEILANTTFSGDTLALVSDFHIADGVSLSVSGSLALDGCSLISPGSFDIVLNTGASLDMTRCEIRGASLFLVGSDLRLVDNLFYDSTGFVFGTVQGAEVFHNVFHGGVGQFEILPGANIATEVEGWGNVQTIEEARNRLMLEWMDPGLPGRTLDSSDGTLYVQPGDPVRVEIDSGGFTGRVQAAELLLAYHSGYLGLTGYNPRAPWANLLYLLDQPLTLFGKVDAAAGFGFALEDPDGTLEDHIIGDFAFEATPEEGRTVVFFREKDAGDNPQIETRLTTSGAGEPSYFNFPFTRNSGTLVIDGTPPLIDGAGATVTQDLGSGPVEVLQSGLFTRIGTVAASFAAYDGLAGVDPASVSVVFDGPTTLNATPATTGEETIGDLTYTRYGFELAVGEGIQNGLYDVIATVTDRSGNVSQSLLGTVEVAKLIATVNVRGQGLSLNPITRNVTFVLTDSGGVVLETRTVAVDFSGSAGATVLAGLPAATANLSAKTAWTQRRRLACPFDASGDAIVNFTGVSLLRGGDLNGDNIINLIDYNILNGNWFTTSSAADISGEGVVNVLDFNILNSNWFTIGDPR